MNGYIQIDLGGKLRSLKFNMHAIEIISERGTTTEHGNLAAFIYGGLCGNSFAKSNGTSPICEESFEVVLDWAEDILVNKNEDLKIQIVTAFNESKPMKAMREQGEEAKKKTRKKN
jgi:hypothetical protein